MAIKSKRFLRNSLLILGVVLADAVFLGVTGLAEPEKDTRIPCAGNLKQIGLACKMYANDNKGVLPPGFKTMYAEKYLEPYQFYLCPATLHKEGSSPKDLDGVEHCDYLYFGTAGKDAYYEDDKNAGKQVLACDRPGAGAGVKVYQNRRFSRPRGPIDRRDGQKASGPGGSRMPFGVVFRCAGDHSSMRSFMR